MKNVIKRSITITVILTLLITLMAAFVTDETFAASKTHLKKSTLTLTVGKSYSQKLLTASGKTISSSKITWKSSNKSVATVSSKGVIKAKKAGKVTIKATYKGTTYKCKCTIKNTLSKQAAEIEKLINHGMGDMSEAISQIRKSKHTSAIATSICLISDFEEALDACEGYPELVIVKKDLKAVNKVLNNLSFTSGWVSGTSKTSEELLNAFEDILPYLEDAVWELLLLE